LTGHRTSGCIVGSRVIDVSQEITRAQKTLELTVAQHGEQVGVRC